MPTPHDLLSTGLLAYIGPGVGIGMIGALLGLIASVGGAFFVALLHPVKQAWQRVRGRAPVLDDVDV